MGTPSAAAPYFEDLEVGQVFDSMPAVTITPGLAAAHLATFGDPLALALSAPLSRAVTGRAEPLANPALALSVALGQSTVVTRRVVANLFYRRLRLRPAFVGDTLSTRVEVLALRENRRREGRAPSGMALLEVTTTDQDGATVMSCERSPMLPMRSDAPTGRADDLGEPADPTPLAHLADLAPPGWSLGPLRETAGPAAAPPWPVGEERTEELRDTVSSAREYVRLTNNVAMAHRDGRFGQRGARLVYGGHTVGLAQAALARLCPSVATVVAWRSCDHLAPVFEDDAIETTARLLAEHPLPPDARLLEFEVLARAERAAPEAKGRVDDVLRWQPVVLAAAPPADAGA